MLSIRMQRTGRRGHAQFRLVVQNSRVSPTSGRVVAYLGSYDPHSKVAKFDKEKVAAYLNNGAQPSDRTAKLLKKEGVKLPAWVKLAEPQKRTTRHPEKLRRNRPKEAPAASSADGTPADDAQAQAPAEAAEQPVEESASPAVAEAKEPAAETEPTDSEEPSKEATKTDEQS